jgi:sortase A
MTPRSPVRLLAGGLVLLGLVLAGLWLTNYVETRNYQSTESRRLETALRQEHSTVTPAPGPAKVTPATSPAKVTPAPGPAKVTPASGPARRSTPSVAAAKVALGRIEIPRLRISGMIAEGTDTRTLKRAVGHVVRTSRPGEAGNVGLAAHRDGFFRGLGGVRKDDLIRIVTVRGTYSYRVEWMEVVEPHRIDVLDSTAEPSLTLITCYPFNWIGPAPKRFVVRARQFES